MARDRSARNFFTNWREYEGSAGTKILLTLRNRARATKNVATGGRSCCGHHGEPGC